MLPHLDVGQHLALLLVRHFLVVELRQDVPDARRELVDLAVGRLVQAFDLL